MNNCKRYLAHLFTGLFFFNSAAIATETVQLTGKLSQTMFVQNGLNTVYLDIIIKAPKQVRPKTSARATDMMILLDRSGSMGGAKKMTFAKAAIHDVLARLTEQDRFSLVSFSNDGVVHSPFVKVTAGARENLDSLVNTISPEGGTNMSDGLQSALRLTSSNSSSERVKKVLLLSDGQANQGISTPEGLSQIVTQITQTGAVVSAIGMGLDFNETLLTTLADYGMGHYSYLEDLSGLAKVLEKDLSDTRTIFANSSTLDINLSEGVTVLDAGGYPVTKMNSSTHRITTGQILDNTDKHFVITFNIPVSKVGSVSLGKILLNYQADNKAHQTPLMSENKLNLSVVESKRRDEALKSVDESIYRQTWMKNNLGRMKKSLSKSVRDGDKAKAKKAIVDYKEAIKKAEEESNVKLSSPAIQEELKVMDDEVDEAFEGSATSQATKRKRTSKSIQKDSISKQRSIDKF